MTVVVSRLITPYPYSTNHLVARNQGDEGFRAAIADMEAGKAYSTALRECAVTAYDSGHWNGMETAERFNVSMAWIQRRRKGSRRLQDWVPLPIERIGQAHVQSVLTHRLRE